MLAKSHRFHGYGSLRSVYQRGQTVRGPQLSLKFANRGRGRSYRVAVVVSRQVSKKAVTRNRIRRRIIEVVRHADGRIPPGTDLVFTAYSEDLATIEADRLRDSISDLLKKALSQPAG